MREEWKSRPGRVAVVEDSDFVRSFVMDVLREEGHAVTDFNCAEALLDSSALQHTEIVVTDLMMEGMGGMALIEHLQARHASIEIIVVTVMADATTAVRAMRAGAFDYLVKPINPEVLKLTLARALEKRRLLEQNHRLRRDLGLAQAGQRLLACESDDNIAEVCAEALLQNLEAYAIVVEVGEHSLCIRNLEACHAEHLLELARTAHENSSRLVDVSYVSAKLGFAVVATVGSGDESMRIVAARPPDLPALETREVEDTSFLLRHALNALVNHRTYARARDEALRDPLTTLYNARFFQDALELSLESGMFNSSPVSVLFMDIDHFKKVNDVHGHLLGSALLVELGRVIRRCVRETDVVARFGGDEFVVLLEQAPAEGAMGVAERIRRDVAAHPFLAREELRLHITVSIGVSCWPDHATNALKLCDCADEALYEVKNSTRNAVRLAKTPTGT